MTTKAPLILELEDVRTYYGTIQALKGPSRENTDRPARSSVTRGWLMAC